MYAGIDPMACFLYIHTHMRAYTCLGGYIYEMEWRPIGQVEDVFFSLCVYRCNDVDLLNAHIR